MESKTEISETTVIIDTSKDCVSELLLCFLKLESKQADFVQINEYTIPRSAFELKNGRFNKKKYLDVMPWAFYSDFMHKMANFSN